MSKRDQWNAEIGKLDAEVRRVAADGRIAAQEHLETARQRQPDAEAKPNTLRDASEETAKDMRAGAADALVALA